MSILVKICGIATEEAVDAARAHGADMAGFVFCEQSPRHVSLDLAARLGKRTGKRMRKVLLTVDAGDALLAAAIAALEPALIQLHGRETPERAASIRAVAVARDLEAASIVMLEEADHLSRCRVIAEIAREIS